MTSAVRVAALLLFAVVLVLAAGCGTVNKLTFPVQPPGYGPDDAPLTLTTSDGVRLKARHWRAETNEWTLLVSHGNAEDIGHLKPFLDWLHRRGGFNVFAYDYRGYGHSGGRPSERGTYRDIQAAWDHVTGSAGVPPDRVILFGRSLGGGPSIWLATRESAAGLALESTFTTAFQVLLPDIWWPGDIYRNVSRIDDIRCPVLIVHGRHDRIVPVAQAERLHRRAPEPRRLVVVENANHNNIALADKEGYLRRLREFCDSLARPSNHPPRDGER